jgi:hypothetical protein
MATQQIIYLVCIPSILSVVSCINLLHHIYPKFSPIIAGHRGLSSIFPGISLMNIILQNMLES